MQGSPHAWARSPRQRAVGRTPFCAGAGGARLGAPGVGAAVPGAGTRVQAAFTGLGADVQRLCSETGARGSRHPPQVPAPLPATPRAPGAGGRRPADPSPARGRRQDGNLRAAQGGRWPSAQALAGPRRAGADRTQRTLGLEESRSLLKQSQTHRLPRGPCPQQTRTLPIFFKRLKACGFNGSETVIRVC